MKRRLNAAARTKKPYLIEPDKWRPCPSRVFLSTVEETLLGGGGERMKLPAALEGKRGDF